VLAAIPGLGRPLLGKIFADEAVRVRDRTNVDSEHGWTLQASGNLSSANEGDVGVQPTAGFEDDRAVCGQLILRLQLRNSLPDVGDGGACCALVGGR
jgi:hypothetical protein